jgi:hypothetical protein
MYVILLKGIIFATHYSEPMTSFLNLYKKTNRATPRMLRNYKLSLLQNKTFNEHQPIEEWTHLNIEQTFMSKKAKFHVNKSSKRNVGLGNC